MSNAEYSSLRCVHCGRWCTAVFYAGSYEFSWQCTFCSQWNHVYYRMDKDFFSTGSGAAFEAEKGDGE